MYQWRDAGGVVHRDLLVTEKRRVRSGAARSRYTPRMRTLDVTKLRDLTGPGITDEYGVGGTDLGAATTAPDGRIVAVFGDTFESREAGGPGWRSPVILFGDPGSVRSGLMWNGTAGPSRGYADQVVSYRHNARIGGRLGGLIGGTRITTQLPTDLLTVGDTMYLHVMACEGLGNVHWTEIHRSRDNGVSWESTGLSWPGGHLGGMFQMLTWELGPDGYVYALSTGFQRDKGLLLQRVHADHLLDAAAWEGWGFADGAWGWGNPPTPVLPGAFGELSLRRVGGHVVALRVRRRELPHRPHPDARWTDDRPHHRRAPHGRLGLRVGRGGPRLRARGPALRRLHPARLHVPGDAPRRQPVAHERELAVPGDALPRPYRRLTGTPHADTSRANTTVLSRYEPAPESKLPPQVISRSSGPAVAP